MDDSPFFHSCITKMTAIEERRGGLFDLVSKISTCVMQERGWWPAF